MEVSVLVEVDVGVGVEVDVEVAVACSAGTANEFESPTCGVAAMAVPGGNKACNSSATITKERPNEEKVMGASTLEFNKHQRISAFVSSTTVVKKNKKPTDAAIEITKAHIG